MHKILRVNVMQRRCQYEDIRPAWQGLGGRGLSAHIIAEEVSPACNPLSPENKLVLAPGILSGTSCPNCGRLSVGSKSPLTNGIKESNVGGNAAAKIARLGLAAVIIEGQASAGTPCVLIVEKDSARLVSAPELRGLGTYELCRMLHAAYSRQHAIICIGPAGEQLLASASLQVTDLGGNPCRAAGRGGLGAVMGSKGLKAILIDDTGGAAPELADPERFSAGQRRAAAAIRNHPVSGQAMPAQGTAMIVAPMNAMGAFPARNAVRGTFDSWEQISGDALACLISRRNGKPTHAGCSNCIIGCSNVFVDEKGAYITSGLEYETIWALGGMCEIADLDAIARFDFLCDDLGIDTMNAGCAIAVAMEAGLRKFGDVAGALELVREVGAGSEIGTLIGAGPAAVGRRYGIERVPVVKNQSIAGYDPRAIQGMGVTYATSPMGADHTAGWTVAACVEAMGGKLDPLSPVGQVACSQQAQIHQAAFDCTGLCQFTGFPLSDDPEGAAGMLEMLTARSGRQVTAADMVRLGKQVLRLEHNFNLKAGLTAADDRLPAFFYREPLPPHNKTFLVKDEELDRFFEVLDAEPSSGG
jgi:aldehyde:ferredoxin oxidoreductase